METSGEKAAFVILNGVCGVKNPGILHSAQNDLKCFFFWEGDLPQDLNARPSASLFLHDPRCYLAVTTRDSGSDFPFVWDAGYALKKTSCDWRAAEQ